MSVPAVSSLRESSQTTFSPLIAGATWSNSLGRGRPTHPENAKVAAAAAARSRALRAIGFITPSLLQVWSLLKFPVATTGGRGRNRPLPTHRAMPSLLSGDGGGVAIVQ